MWTRLKVITGYIWDFIRPTVQLLVSDAGHLAMNAALTAVSAAAKQTDISGREKFELAFKLVQSDLQKKGIVMLTRHLNSIIELAYEKYLASVENL